MNNNSYFKQYLTKRWQQIYTSPQCKLIWRGDIQKIKIKPIGSMFAILNQSLKTKRVVVENKISTVYLNFEGKDFNFNKLNKKEILFYLNFDNQQLVTHEEVQSKLFRQIKKSHFKIIIKVKTIHNRSQIIPQLQMFLLFVKIIRFSQCFLNNNFHKLFQQILCYSFLIHLNFLQISLLDIIALEPILQSIIYIFIFCIKRIQLSKNFYQQRRQREKYSINPHQQIQIKI